jgi:hypothetical protein
VIDDLGLHQVHEGVVVAYEVYDDVLVGPQQIPSR